MLVQEKVQQAKKILKEFDIDCWITFVRESQINGDPTLAFLVTADVTWHSAFIITKQGKTCAIVGKYDQKTVEDSGAYDEVYSFVEGIKNPLLDYLKKVNPSQIAERIFLKVRPRAFARIGEVRFQRASMDLLGGGNTDDQGVQQLSQLFVVAGLRSCYDRLIREAN